MSIRLEELSKEDRDWVFQLTSNPKVAEYMRFDTHTCREEAEALIEEYTADGSYGYRVTDFETGEVIGVAALKYSSEEESSISLFFSPEYWNRGIAAEVVRLLKVEASRIGIKYLSAYVVEENIGSRKVMDRCGFEVHRIMRFDDMTSGLYVYGFDMEYMEEGGVE